MAEEEKKEEEKFEFDAAGESLAYISLDHARVLAIRHAQQNTDFYGSRYDSQDLLWEELSAEEGEDYYRIRLSYRQARGFQGEPGVEQFTIDKTGAIELRQILSEPRPVRRFPIGIALTGVLLAAEAATMGVLLASGVFSSSGAADPIVVDITPNEAARFVSEDGGVTIDLSAETVDAPTQLAYRSLSDAEIPVLPQQFRTTGKAFDLTTEAVLLKPIATTVAISAADAELAGAMKPTS